MAASPLTEWCCSEKVAASVSVWTTFHSKNPYFSVQEILTGVREGLALGNKWQNRPMETA